ncbi:MAG TPA: Ig-like domain-containing protein, partial [Polyangiaceae bacterium]|nr:Ig-like domain-containing protein [Polyangiaceae bacterium]
DVGQLEQALEGPIQAVRDGFYNVDQGQTLVVGATEGLLANDSGASPLTASADAVSRRGNPIEVQPDGSFTFTPGPDFFGEDRIDYVLTDGSGAQKISGARIVVRPIVATTDSIMAGSAGFSITAGYSDVKGPELEVLGDVNGDGFGDFGIEDYGLFHVVFGKADRSPVQTGDPSLGNGFTIDEEGSVGFPWYGSLTGLGDVNGDGFNDVGVSSRDYYETGSGCFVVFGKNDSTTVQLEDVATGDGGFLITDSADYDLGCKIIGPGDVNGDGLDDVVIERTTYFGNGIDGIYVVFGKPGSQSADLADIEAGVGGYALFTEEASAEPVDGAGDMNQDGRADFLIEFGPGGGPNGGAVVFGKSDTQPGTLDGAIQGGGGFYIQAVPGSEAYLTDPLSGGGDVNGDGIPDITVRNQFEQGLGRFRTQAGYVIFGKSDAAPVDLAMVSAGVGGFFVDGESDHFLGPFIIDDVNADGLDDLSISDGAADVMGVPDSGALYVAYGRSTPGPLLLEELETGSGGFVLHGTTEDQILGWGAATAGDVNADGFGDLLYIEDFTLEGYDYTFGMLLGADFTGSVTKMGSPLTDTLVASAGAAVSDVLVGERGDDRLSSDGGPDVLLGGSGADHLTIVDANFSRVDAGTGKDVLKIGSDGMALALDAIPSSRLRSIEVVDAVGAGANAIRVDVLRALPLPVGLNTLTLRADASDTVTVVRGSATVASGGGFVTYTLGRFKLRISNVASIVEE